MQYAHMSLQYKRKYSGSRPRRDIEIIIYTKVYNLFKPQVNNEQRKDNKTNPANGKLTGGSHKKWKVTLCHRPLNFFFIPLAVIAIYIIVTTKSNKKGHGIIR